MEGGGKKANNSPRLNDIKQQRISHPIPHLVRIRLLELLYPQHIEVLHRVRVPCAVRDRDARVLAFRQKVVVFDGGERAGDVFVELRARTADQHLDIETTRRE